MKGLQSGNRELTPRMKQVVEFIFNNPTMTQKQVGAALGISHSRVSEIMRSRRVLEAFPIIARARIKGMVPEAVKRYQELLNQKVNLEVSRKVADRLLDTNKVLEPETKVQVNVFAQMPTKDLVDRVSEAAKFSISNAIDGELVNPDEESLLSD